MQNIEYMIHARNLRQRKSLGSYVKSQPKRSYFFLDLPRNVMTYCRYNSPSRHYILHFSRRYGNLFFASLYEHHLYWIFATDDVSVFDFWKECFIATIRRSNFERLFLLFLSLFLLQLLLVIAACSGGSHDWKFLASFVIIWNSNRRKHNAYKWYENKMEFNVWTLNDFKIESANV